MTKTQLNEQLRAEIIPVLTAVFEKENDVCRIASNKIAIPAVDAEGNEKWVTITGSVPTDADFDGYNEATFYQDKMRLKAEKAAERQAVAEKRQKTAEIRKAQKANTLNK